MNVAEIRNHIEALSKIQRYRFTCEVFKLTVCEFVRQSFVMEYDKYGAARIVEHSESEVQDYYRTIARIGELIGLDYAESKAIANDVKANYNVGSEVIF